ncbi:MAG: hypothetical protein IJX90_10020 [Blautia sp.]|nr:hypothetical protein [Blautia sp.]
MMKDGTDSRLDTKIDEEDLEKVEGGMGVYGARTEVHFCSKCGKRTLCIEVGNGYVCKICGTLN